MNEAQNINPIDQAAVSRAVLGQSLRPWQTYLFSRFPRSEYVPIPEHARRWDCLWRHATWEAFASDTVHCNGTQMATLLSMVYKPKVVAEFGLDAGLTTLQFCKLNPEAQVFGVDASETHPSGFSICCHAINNNVKNLTLAIMPSWEFSMPGKVDLCFIDADHLGDSPMKDTRRAWANRNTSRDWCIAWDDYHENNPDVKNAVDAFVAEVGMQLHQVGSWFYIGTRPHSEVEALR